MTKTVTYQQLASIIKRKLSLKENISGIRPFLRKKYPPGPGKGRAWVLNINMVKEVMKELEGRDVWKTKGLTSDKSKTIIYELFQNDC